MSKSTPKDSAAVFIGMAVTIVWGGLWLKNQFGFFSEPISMQLAPQSADGAYGAGASDLIASAVEGGAWIIGQVIIFLFTIGKWTLKTILGAVLRIVAKLTSSGRVAIAAQKFTEPKKHKPGSALAEIERTQVYINELEARVDLNSVAAATNHQRLEALEGKA